MGRLRAMGILVLLAAAAIGVVAQEGDQPELLDQLVTQLATAGWTEVEITEFVSAAAPLDWNGAGDADPQVVVLALSYFRDQASAGATLGDAARFARELAGVTAAMSRAGLGSVEIARAAMTGTRDVLAESPGRPNGAGQDGRPSEGAGSTIREQVLSRVRDRVRANSAGRGPEMVPDAMGRPGDPPGRDGPLPGPPGDVPGPYGPGSE